MIVVTMMLALFVVVFLALFFTGKHIKILSPQDIAMIIRLNNVNSVRETRSFIVVTIPWIERSIVYVGRPQAWPIFEEKEVELKDQLNAVFTNFVITFQTFDAAACFRNCPGRIPENAFRKLAPGKLSEASRKLTSAEMSEDPTAFKTQLMADIQELCRDWGVRIVDVIFVYHSPDVMDEAARIRTVALANADRDNIASQQEVTNFQREFQAEGPTAWVVNQVGPWFVEASRNGAFQFFGLGGDSDLTTKVQALIKQQQGGANDSPSK